MHENAYFVWFCRAFLVSFASTVVAVLIAVADASPGALGFSVRGAPVIWVSLAFPLCGVTLLRYIREVRRHDLCLEAAVSLMSSLQSLYNQAHDMPLLTPSMSAPAYVETVAAEILKSASTLKAPRLEAVPSTHGEAEYFKKHATLNPVDLLLNVFEARLAALSGRGVLCGVLLEVRRSYFLVLRCHLGKELSKKTFMYNTTFRPQPHRYLLLCLVVLFCGSLVSPILHTAALTRVGAVGVTALIAFAWGAFAEFQTLRFVKNGSAERNVFSYTALTPLPPRDAVDHPQTRTPAPPTSPYTALPAPPTPAPTPKVPPRRVRSGDGARPLSPEVVRMVEGLAPRNPLVVQQRECSVQTDASRVSVSVPKDEYYVEDKGTSTFNFDFSDAEGATVREASVSAEMQFSHAAETSIVNDQQEEILSSSGSMYYLAVARIAGMWCQGGSGFSCKISANGTFEAGNETGEVHVVSTVHSRDMQYSVHLETTVIHIASLGAGGDVLNVDILDTNSSYGTSIVLHRALSPPRVRQGHVSPSPTRVRIAEDAAKVSGRKKQKKRSDASNVSKRLRLSPEQQQQQQALSPVRTSVFGTTPTREASLPFGGADPIISFLPVEEAEVVEQVVEVDEPMRVASPPASRPNPYPYPKVARPKSEPQLLPQKVVLPTPAAASPPPAAVAAAAAASPTPSWASPKASSTAASPPRSVRGAQDTHPLMHENVSPDVPAAAVNVDPDMHLSPARTEATSYEDTSACSVVLQAVQEETVPARPDAKLRLSVLRTDDAIVGVQGIIGSEGVTPDFSDYFIGDDSPAKSVATNDDTLAGLLDTRTQQGGSDPFEEPYVTHPDYL